MRSPLFLALACCTTASWSFAGEINFTPHPDKSLMDGSLVQRVWFASPETRISIRTLPDWEVTGTPAGLRISSRKFREAEAQLENADGPRPAQFDEDGLVKYREIARKALPPLAEEVKPLDEKPNSFPINEWQSFEVAYSYVLTGRKFVRRFVFLKLDPQHEVRLTMDAIESDADKFYGQLRNALNSWLETKI